MECVHVNPSVFVFSANHSYKLSDLIISNIQEMAHIVVLLSLCSYTEL